MGRTSLMLIIAFNVTFMAMGLRSSNASSSAYDKYCAYAQLEQASLAAESAANIAISDAFFTPGSVIPNTKVTFPEGGPGTIQIIKTPMMIGASIVGYTLTVNGERTLISGTNGVAKSTTTIRVAGNSFSQYVMYSVTEKIGTTPIYWRTGEVCRGPLHTQDNLYTDGTPRFEGKVTIKQKLNKKNGTPNFVVGYTEGVDIPMQATDLVPLTTLGGAGGPNASYTGVRVFVEFLPNGSITVRTVDKTSTKDGWAAKPSDGFSVGTIKACTTYASVANLTSTGVLLVNNAELHVKGVLNGRITLGAVGANSLVMIDSSVVYKDPPPTPLNPNLVTDDLLGIVSENDIRITDTAHPSTSSSSTSCPNYTPANNNCHNSAKGVTIDGSMFSKLGGFGAERYDTRDDCGILTVRGGIQQQGRDPVGQSPDGFSKDYSFDNRLYTDRPVGYPTTRYLVQNWKDSTDIPLNFWE